MWTYWALQEGTLAVDPGVHRQPAAACPPVLHVDSDAPLYDDTNGDLDHGPDVGDLLQARLLLRRRAGRAPYVIDRPAARSPWTRTARKPRLHRAGGFRPDVDLRRSRTATSASQGKGHLYRQRADRRDRRVHAGQLPRLRHFCENAYVIADSNHGYKMIGVGALVARELLGERRRCSSRSGSPVPPASLHPPATRRSPGADAPRAADRSSFPREPRNSPMSLRQTAFPQPHGGSRRHLRRVRRLRLPLAVRGRHHRRVLGVPRTGRHHGPDSPPQS